MADCERERQNTKNYWGLTLFSRGVPNNVDNLQCFVGKVNVYLKK
jgi:hypothetical protein